MKIFFIVLFCVVFLYLVIRGRCRVGSRYDKDMTVGDLPLLEF
jgi:hypothetical protein